MAFLDNWIIVQRNYRWETTCADYNLPLFKIRIETPDGADIEQETIVDMFIFDSKGWNIHNQQCTIIADIAALNLGFTEKYRDGVIYAAIPKEIVLEVIDILSGKNSKTTSNIPLARQEKACYRCKRMCDIGDVSCWWCTTSDPTK